MAPLKEKKVDRGRLTQKRGKVFMTREKDRSFRRGLPIKKPPFWVPPETFPLLKNDGKKNTRLEKERNEGRRGSPVNRPLKKIRER